MAITSISDVQTRLGGGFSPMGRSSTAQVSMDIMRSPEWRNWVNWGQEANDYLGNIKGKFNIRDDNYREMFELRHGLIQAYLPASHREVVPIVTSKEAGEIIERLVAILSAVYPKFIFQATSLKPESGIEASNLSALAESLWLAIEDRQLLPIFRLLNDQQLAYGGGVMKVINRFDRWDDLPFQGPDESKIAYNQRVDIFKAEHIPFDVIVPEYNTLFYDVTSEGLSRVLERHQLSVYEVADMFGGSFDDKNKKLRLPVEIGLTEEEIQGYLDEGYEWDEIPETKTSSMVINATRTVEYMEFWKKGEWCIYVINGTPVRVDYLAENAELPYFLALGMVTSSPDPGRMGLPVLYNAIEDFKRKLNLRTQNDAFLWKHGFARLVHTTTHGEGAAGSLEPDVGDEDQEEEQLGEVLEVGMDEDWKYLYPANVSNLFMVAIDDVNKSLQSVALSDVMTGKTPPSGTTGWLWTNMAAAANSKYLPILHQAARAIRKATLYMMRQMDEFNSPTVVPAQTGEVTEGAFLYFTPGMLGFNYNLKVEINAPMPDDRITQTEYLTKGNLGGYITRRRVQKEGYQVEHPDDEDLQILIEKFDQFYQPIAMMKGLQRAGRLDELAEAAAQGLLPPELAQLAQMFAVGPDQQAPPNIAEVVGNPNGVMPAGQQPGLGEPAQPTVGATANAGPVAPTAAVG